MIMLQSVRYEQLSLTDLQWEHWHVTLSILMLKRELGIAQKRNNSTYWLEVFFNLGEYCQDLEEIEQALDIKLVLHLMNSRIRGTHGR